MTDFIWATAEFSTKETKATDLYRSQNEIWFNTDIHNESINKLIKLMYEVIHDEKLSAYRDDTGIEIILHLDSGGGVLSSTFKFIDFCKQLQKKNIKIRTIINGKACSAATLMAIIGNKRQITKHSYAMIHELSSATWGSMTQMRSYQKHLDHVHDQMLEIYTEHLSHNQPNNTEYKKLEQSEIESLLNKETWFSSTEYKNKGFVDEII